MLTTAFVPQDSSKLNTEAMLMLFADFPEAVRKTRCGYCCCFIHFLFCEMWNLSAIGKSVKGAIAAIR